MLSNKKKNLSKNIIENKYLKFSLISSFIFAIIGVLLGIKIKSTILLFDGIYSLLCAITTTIIILVNIYIHKNHKNNIYIKNLSDTIIILLKSLFLIFFCSYNFLTNFIKIFNIENSYNYKNGFIYTFISTLVCFLIYLYIKFKNKNINSNLLIIEIKQWQIDTILSFSILISFIFIYTISNTIFNFLIPYTEPLLMIILSSFFIKDNIKIFFNNINYDFKFLSILK